jgi:hypothetical protein
MTHSGGTATTSPAKVERHIAFWVVFGAVHLLFLVWITARTISGDWD